MSRLTIFKISWDFSDILHTHYAITIHLYHWRWICITDICFAQKTDTFRTSHCRCLCTSTYPTNCVWLADSSAICCMFALHTRNKQKPCKVSLLNMPQAIRDETWADHIQAETKYFRNQSEKPSCRRRFNLSTVKQHTELRAPLTAVRPSTLGTNWRVRITLRN
jgi:hypothetical protein